MKYSIYNYKSTLRLCSLLGIALMIQPAIFSRASAYVEVQIGTKIPEAEELNEMAWQLFQEHDPKTWQLSPQQEQKYNEAISVMEKSTEIYKGRFGENNPDYAKALNKAGHFYSNLLLPLAIIRNPEYRKTIYQKAEQAYQQAIKIQKEALGEEHPDYANIIENMADFYLNANEPEKAEEFQEKALSIYEKSLGKRHPDYAKALKRAGDLYRRFPPVLPSGQPLRTPEDFTNLQKKLQERKDKTEQYYQQALEIQKEVLGEKHINYARTLSDIAISYSSMPDKAEQYCQKALLSYEESSDKKDIGYVEVLNNVGMAYMQMGMQTKKYSEVEQVYQKILKLQKETIGEKHADYLGTLAKLANLYKTTNDRVKQDDIYEKAFAIQEKTPKHALYLGQIATFYMGDDYEQNEKGCKLLNKALAIEAEVLGEKHSQYINTLETLAAWYHTFIYDYNKAEILYKKLANITREVYGDKSREYFLSINSLVSLYSDMAEYGKAEPLCKQMQEIQKESVDKKERIASDAIALHSQINIHTSLGAYNSAESLNGNILKNKLINQDPIASSDFQGQMGWIYFFTGRYGEAEQFFQKAVATLKNSVFGENPALIYMSFYVDNIFGLARTYQAIGEYNKAEKLYQQVYEADKSGGMSDAKNPRYAAHLSAIASLYSTQGNYSKAESLFKETLEIQKNTLSEKNPGYSSSLIELGLMYGYWQKPQPALNNFLTGFGITNSFITDMANWGTEQKIQVYSDTIDKRYDYFYSLLSKFYNGASEETSKAFGAHLAYKGRIVDLLSRRNRLALLSNNPKLENIIKDLKDITQQIAQLSLKRPEKLDPAKYKQLVAELDKKKEQLEEKLSRNSAEYTELQASQGISADNVIKALPLGGVYLDFVEYTKYDFAAKKWTNEKNYLAFLLKRDSADKTELLIKDLGHTDEIDTLIAKFREEINLESKPMSTAGNTQRTDISALAVSNKPIYKTSEKLYEKILAPFNNALNQATILHISPSGNLHLIPFEILYNPEQRGYLCDSIPVVYTTGRDLCAMKVAGERLPKEELPKQIYIVAAPDFSTVKDYSQQIVSANSSRPLTLLRGKIQGWPIKFDALPETLKEADAIKNVAGDRNISLYAGNKATEEIVKSISRPQILHLATHGFFIENAEYQASKEKTRGVGGFSLVDEVDILDRTMSKEPPELSNPMLRSGLALAGANRIAEDIPIPEGKDDGILTAAEVTGIDLYGTDLVVLSACDTGLGNVQRGEGVAGLRRAFRIAGARNVVMSLWNVPDKETVWLMEEFYKGYFQGDKPAIALNKARNALRKRLIERDGTDSPYYWAAFIIEGSAP